MFVSLLILYSEFGENIMVENLLLSIPRNRHGSWCIGNHLIGQRYFEVFVLQILESWLEISISLISIREYKSKDANELSHLKYNCIVVWEMCTLWLNDKPTQLCLGILLSSYSIPVSQIKNWIFHLFLFWNYRKIQFYLE